LSDSTATVPAQLGDGGPDIATRGWVESLRELVEDHEPWPAQQRQDEEQPLSLATAERCERGSPPLAQPELLEQPLTVACITAGEERGRLADAQPIGQRRLLQLAADQRTQLLGLRGRVEPKHPQAALVRSSQPLDALHRRGLARAVGADEAEHLAGLDVEVQVVDDPAGPVALAQTANGHRMRFGHAAMLPVLPRPHIGSRVDLGVAPRVDRRLVDDVSWNGYRCCMLWDAQRVAEEAGDHVAGADVAGVVAAVTAGWVLEPSAGDGATCVRVGGGPRLASDEQWPSNEEGAPLTFLAEVDLGALPGIPDGWTDPRPPRLQSGLLRLFADLGRSAYEPCAAFALHRSGDTDARPASRPAWPTERPGEDQIFELPATQAAARPFLTLPEAQPGVEPGPPYEVDEGYRNLAMRIRVGQSQEWLDDLMRHGPDPWSLCHFFGHATSVQDDSRYAARHEHPEVALQDWSVVLGLHDGWGGLQILDGGAYHVLAPAADLENGRWGRAVCDVSSC
jgi:hypothetical protein